MIRVFVVDEQAEVRRGLRMRLAIEPDMAVVGEAGDTEEALALAQTLEPDVIVIDIGRRGLDSINIIWLLREAAPTAAVVVLSLCGDEDTRAQAQEAGARAFLEKYGGAADLLQTIRRIAPRRFYVGNCIATSPLATRRLSVG
jgi:DNA-binding NarL/FixJ family response regulator